MTDAEIIKALECHADSDLASCKECPLLNIQDCCYLLSKEAFDLINRQKAEIETEKTKVEFLERANSELYNTNRLLNQQVAESFMDSVKAGTKAIKEFAERLKARAKETVVYKNELCAMGTPFVIVKDIDNLVKEMVGDME